MANQEDSDAIRELRRSYMVAQDAGDAEGCVSHWDANGVLMPPNEPAVQGAAALLEFYRSLFSQVQLAIKIEFDQIEMSDGWSFARGTYSGKVIPKDGGEVIDDAGKYLEIHRRQEDGAWKFSCHMFSSDAAEQ